MMNLTKSPTTTPTCAGEMICGPHPQLMASNTAEAKALMSLLRIRIFIIPSGYSRVSSLSQVFFNNTGFYYFILYIFLQKGPVNAKNSIIRPQGETS